MYLDFMKLSALIVDDEYSGRIAIKILLEKYFIKIFTEPLLSNNLEDAKEKAGNNKFDICFLDIELNNKSGFDLLPYLDKQTKDSKSIEFDSNELILILAFDGRFF